MKNSRVSFSSRTNISVDMACGKRETQAGTLNHATLSSTCAVSERRDLLSESSANKPSAFADDHLFAGYYDNRCNRLRGGSESKYWPVWPYPLMFFPRRETSLFFPPWLLVIWDLAGLKETLEAEINVLWNWYCVRPDCSQGRVYWLRSGHIHLGSGRWWS